MPGVGHEETSPLRLPSAEMLDRPDIERPSTIAQLMLPPSRILRRSAYRCIRRNAAVLPGKHLTHVIGLDQSAAGNQRSTRTRT